MGGIAPVHTWGPDYDVGVYRTPSYSFEIRFLSEHVSRLEAIETQQLPCFHPVTLGHGKAQPHLAFYLCPELQMLFPTEPPSSPAFISLYVSFPVCLVEQQLMPQKAADVAGKTG